MKVNNFVAEMVGEIAEEFDFLVYKYNSDGESTSITFERTKEDQTKVYRYLNYIRGMLHLHHPNNDGITEVNLHDPQSIDTIKNYFENSKYDFDNPYIFNFDPNFLNPILPTTTTYPKIVNHPYQTSTIPTIWIDDTSTTSDPSITWYCTNTCSGGAATRRPSASDPFNIKIEM